MKANFKNLNLPRKTTVTSTWSAKHSAIVHEGATLRNGTEYPARPWVSESVKRFDFIGECQGNLERSPDVRQAFLQMAKDFGDACQNAIQSPRWNWPRTTVRRNGDVVGSPRDIVDTKEILNSYSQEVDEY